MNLLWKPSLIEPLKHVRKLLDKLGPNDALRCLEGYRGQRALAVLARLKTLVSPRVQASYLRTLCNGWSTRARFQESGVCRFGCGADRDSIPHFAVCPAANDWALRHARLHRAPVGSEFDFYCAWFLRHLIQTGLLDLLRRRTACCRLEPGTYIVYIVCITQCDTTPLQAATSTGRTFSTTERQCKLWLCNF